MSKNRGVWLRAKRSNVTSWLKNSQKFENSLKESNSGKSGHVYVFSLGHDNLYKIGRTKDIQDRLKTLQSSNTKLSCVWSVYTENCYDLEQKIHKQMNNFLVEREIFQFMDFHKRISEINKIAEQHTQQESRSYGQINPDNEYVRETPVKPKRMKLWQAWKIYKKKHKHDKLHGLTPVLFYRLLYKKFIEEKIYLRYIYPEKFGD